MVDLESLKKRIEMVDAQMKTAHSARERESDALKQLWIQIQERFELQSAEIRQLRGQISDLEDIRDELMGLVDSLLGAVEGGISSMSDETVPQIRQMAATLLDGDGAADSATASVASALPAPADVSDGAALPAAEPSLDGTREDDAHDELLAAIERSLELTEDLPDTPAADISFSAPEADEILRETLATAEHAPEEARETRPARPPISPGIRNLVERLEGIGLDVTAEDERTDDRDDDDLNRDLREIEALRGELMGLRERIAGGAR